MGLFNEIDRLSDKPNKDNIIRAPFGYPGGKSRSIYKIIPHLPYRKSYIEPFAGSAAVMLARKSSKLEVFNDRYAGVVAFYRCMRSDKLFEKLQEWIQLTVHAREDFVWCKETWQNVDDPVERAGRWLYMTSYSFGGLGRNWGRSTGSGGLAGKLRRKLKIFPEVHKRFANIQVENQDWEDCIKDYDNLDAVFYCDPPYVDVNAGTYKNEMTVERHRDFLDLVFASDGFFAVSGYSNPLYEERPWTERHQWESFVSIQSMAYTKGNKKEHLRGLETRKNATEVLWIKEAQ